MKFPDLKGWARRTKRDAITLWLAARDPRTPWYAKVLAGLVAAYALSPIDLIPDFIPVLGYLDDVIIVPLGILAVMALLPAGLLTDLRVQAERMAEKPLSRTAAAVIIFIWIVAIGISAAAGWRYFRDGASTP
jgi:uncharacterized membrane protein YkvA (DUF1232 family)